MVSAITREMTPVIQSREATEVRHRVILKNQEKKSQRELTLEKESRADRGVWGKKGWERPKEASDAQKLGKYGGEKFSLHGCSTKISM